LERFNVLSAKDMTFESALVKAMLLLSETDDLRKFGIKFSSSLAGELTE
jgi:L-asparaginase/Glu-tRNA(Gln) amidotransferase subunit D